MVSDTLKICMGKGFLLDKEMLELFSGLTEEGTRKVVEVLGNLGIEERVITKNLFQKHFDKFKSLLILDEGVDEMGNFFAGMGYTKDDEDVCGVDLVNSGNKVGKIKLISAPAFTQRKVEVKDFVRHFRSRYNSLKGFLEVRDFENLSSIRKIGDGRGSYTIIVSVLSKRVTKNKNLFIEVEDLTGTSIVLINRNKKDVFEKGRDLLVDDIVAFNVSGTREMLFANDIIYPEASLSEKKYSEFDEYVAFTSDYHIGNKMFLESNLLRFIKWLNGEEGDEGQRKIARKVKYLLIVGDSVDGVSVFPGQENYLDISNMGGQYKRLAEILKLIRDDIKIIISPGQHDAVWVGEPQPIIGDEWAEELHKMKNVVLVPNPSCIEIDGGFKILMYHGASMHGIIEEIQDIRLNCGHNNPTRVVKEMLKRRHLSPMHGSSDYIPCEKDSLVINPIPDIVATGDQHRSEVSVHNNILLIASSCWQSITPFEEKVGNNPDPCKVPLFNLKTREVKILDFSDVAEDVVIDSKKGGGDK